MDPKSLAIPLAFIMLAAILCWQLIGAKGKWWLKLLAIVVVPGFGLAVWGSIASYKGWPTTDEPPEKALVLASSVREPDPKTGDPGAIYVWLMPLKGAGTALNPFDYVSPGGEPRAYKFPYSRPSHEMLVGAEQSLKDGKPVVFERQEKGKSSGGTEGEPGEEAEDGESADDAQPGHGRPGGRPQQGEGEFKVYELPTPSLPKKPH